jgi:hypothetical protein
MKHIRWSLVVGLFLTGCPGGGDFGESLCEATYEADICDSTNPCGTAVLAASQGDGQCADELAAMIAATPDSYEVCADACPDQETCDFGGTTVGFIDCSCQADCISAAPAAYQDAVQAYADCLHADADVSAGCF